MTAITNIRADSHPVFGEAGDVSETLASVRRWGVYADFPVFNEHGRYIGVKGRIVADAGVASCSDAADIAADAIRCMPVAAHAICGHCGYIMGAHGDHLTCPHSDARADEWLSGFALEFESRPRDERCDICGEPIPADAEWESGDGEIWHQHCIDGWRAEHGETR